MTVTAAIATGTAKKKTTILGKEKKEKENKKQNKQQKKNLIQVATTAQHLAIQATEMTSMMMALVRWQ